MSSEHVPGEASSPGTLHGAALEAHTRKLEAERARAVADAPGVAPTEKREAAPQVDPFQAWVESAPEEYRDKFAQSVVERHAQALAAHYGPEVSALLEEAGKDPDFRRKLGRLTDKERRKFLLESADAIYDAQQGDAPENGKLDAIDQKLVGLEQRMTKAQEDERRERYIADRKSEHEALLAKFPELRWSDPASPQARRLQAVIEEAEIRSQKAQKPVAYGTVYEEMKAMWADQEASPPRAPIRSQGGNAPPNRQAPKNRVEARNSMNAELNKYGGLSALAAALKR